MTDECILKLETQPPMSWIAASTGIEKGAVLKGTNPFTAGIADGDGDIVAGIAQSEKLTGELAVAVYRGGLFTGVAGVAGVTFGEQIQTDAGTSSTNRLVDADAGSTEQFIGTCLETAASGVRFLFELNPSSIDHA